MAWNTQPVYNLYLIRYAVLKKYYVITLAIRLHIGFKMMILAKLYSLEVSLLLVIALNPEGLSPSFILNLNWNMKIWNRSFLQKKMLRVETVNANTRL
jgi:hypothetical protein